MTFLPSKYHFVSNSISHLWGITVPMTSRNRKHFSLQNGNFNENFLSEKAQTNIMLYKILISLVANTS